MSYLKLLAVVWLVAGLSACATTTPPHEHRDSASVSTVYSSTASSATTHTVTRGETLWRIARNYQTDPEEIARVNKIPDSTTISVGQKLVIPGSSRRRATTNFTAGQGTEDFIWPVKGRIAAYFHQQTSGVSNKGIDITTQDIQDVMAARDGRVIFVGRLAGYGETIILDHKDGLSTIYCGYASSCVKLGDDVRQGTTLAKTGSSPARLKDALHFEVRKKHKPQNPLYYLD
ncbi:MAG: peptidoglycan DD-metalloendopeptidase family protein [Candidatus Omnitrophica bacterium]|nr:peptidoglycan DD-metalloendopeptidase family protein [Candidatus Omnitrophota bacterium]MDD5573873.1 peptidoglycan DD-metalloendopeptidase family protein [Candidatus Omnitrophota bacterium]